MKLRRIAASALCLILCCPFLAAATKKLPPRKIPPVDPVCDAIPLPASSIQKPPLSATSQQQLDDKLLDAAEDSDIDAVKELLAKGADPNARDEHCVTPLMISAEYFDTSMAQALLDAGADVNARDMVGWTALLTASDAGNMPAFNLFLAHKANVNQADNDRWTPLVAAVLGSRLDAVQALLAAGAKIRIQDKNGTTPLMFAAAEGDVHVLEALIGGLKADAKSAQTKSPLDDTDYYGWTALHHAANQKRADCVLALINAGANTELRNKIGWVP